MTVRVHVVRGPDLKKVVSVAPVPVAARPLTMRRTFAPARWSRNCRATRSTRHHLLQRGDGPALRVRSALSREVRPARPAHTGRGQTVASHLGGGSTATALPARPGHAGTPGTGLCSRRSGPLYDPEWKPDSIASLFAHVKTGRWASIVPHTWLHVFGVPTGMRAVPLVQPVRTARMGLVAARRNVASVMARAFIEVAERSEMAETLERLPDRMA